MRNSGFAENSSDSILITKFNNELYIAGAFYSICNPIYDLPFAGNKRRGVAKFNGNSFVPLKNGINDVFAVNSGGIALRVINSELYIGGYFDSIAGIKASKIARFDGINWFSYPVLDPVGGGFAIDCITQYKNELYVCGNFSGGGGKEEGFIGST